MSPWVELNEDQVLATIAELDRIRTKINVLLDVAQVAMVMAPSGHEPPDVLDVTDQEVPEQTLLLPDAS